MWQRVQTVLLAIGILCLFAMLFFPLWGGNSEVETVIMYPIYLKTADANIYMPYSLVAILAVSAITLSLIEISKYKNR
ncbi:MAG: DUF4293 domain-containing protein, partial [Cyclobacteriaceae bacterium]|nr:DUF4293 domain-containing protein [Cyclobacteriaceae bacterium]